MKKIKGFLLFALLSLLIIFQSCQSDTVKSVRNGDIDEIKKQLNKDLDPNQVDDDGNTLVFHAIDANQLSMLKELMAAGGELRHSADGKDLLVLAAEKGHKDIASFLWSMPYYFDTWEDREKYLELINKNDWSELFELYLGAEEELLFIDLGDLLMKAEEYGSESIESYLIQNLRNFWPIFESSNQTSFQIKKSAQLLREIENNREKFGIDYVSVNHQTDEITIYFEEIENEFLRIVLDSMLSRPDMEYSLFWGSALKSSYYHNVSTWLPRFLPSISSSSGYNVKSLKNKNYRFKSSLAYLLHRVNRHPEILNLLWKVWKDRFYEEISTHKYVELDFQRTIEALLQNLEHIRNIPAYEDSLKVNWDRLENIHYDENGKEEKYPDDWYMHLSNSLLKKNNWNIDQSWSASFWVRRYHEGNMEVVEKIMKEIKKHYKEDNDFKDLVKAHDVSRANAYLAEASRYGSNVSRMKYAIEMGAEPKTIIGVNGTKEIHAAVLSDDLKYIQRLLEKIDNQDIRDNSRNTPLIFARSPEAAKLLIKHGADVNDERTDEPPLNQFISDNRPDIVKVLIENGASVTKKSSYWSRTALHNVTHYYSKSSLKEIEIIRILLAAGADPRIKDETGETPMKRAERNKDKVVIDLYNKAIEKLEEKEVSE